MNTEGAADQQLPVWWQHPGPAKLGQVLCCKLPCYEGKQKDSPSK